MIFKSPWWCSFTCHLFDKWSEPVKVDQDWTDYIYQARVCKRCGLRETKRCYV